MAKKIAIITTHHEPNYGNKLQNYALQTVLIRMGFDVEVINDARSWPDLTSLWAQKKYIIHAIIPYRRQPWHIKYTKFYFWSKKHIRYSKVNIHADKDIVGLENKYDYFVVGSDQIWNPHWPIFSNKFGFATFARKEQKVAYAPSLGVDEMLPERVDEYKEWLRDWKALSCREDIGAQILRQLTNVRVSVVLDPTLLLTSTEWDMVATKKLIDEPYIVAYYIWQVKDVYEEYLNNIASGKKIVNLSSGEYQACGPDEFISIIKHASLLVTDSFHGCVFAIQYHVPITVINRSFVTEDAGNLSRIETLFNTIGIHNAKFLNVFNEYHKINWKKADENIAVKRDNSLNYLLINLS